MMFGDFHQKLSSCKELALTFALFCLPGIIAPPQVLGTEFNRPDFLALIIVSGLAEAGMMFYLLTHIGGRKLADYNIRPLTLRGVLSGLLFWVLILPLVIAAAALIYLALKYFPGEWSASRPPFRWSYTNYGLLPFTLLACLVTGYREELYFRAYLPAEFFLRGMPSALALLLPVLLFAAGHFYQGGMGFAVACLLGLYFTGVFRKTGDLHVPAIAHGLYNFCALLVSGFDFSVYEQFFPL
ncbi:MAG: CPBP family intramembrane metalloprotease [Spirochaetales bacterium]|jgi:membrane protease YdiL (CAAX protease family)|nr:CPBP family intramembrane metalloprotease [Spirochaetales bacterium]